MEMRTLRTWQIIQYHKGIVIQNMAAMSKGTGAKFLECATTSDEHGEHLIAYQWRRKMPYAGIPAHHILIHFS